MSDVALTQPEVDNSKLSMSNSGASFASRAGITGAIYMTIRTKRGSKRVIARGLISRRAEESAPFRDSAK